MIGSRILKDSTCVLIAEILVGIALLANGVVIARATGAGGKGVFTLVIAGGQLGAAIFGLRWDRSVGHFLARDHRNQDAILWSIALVGGISLFCAALVGLIWPEVINNVVLRGLPADSARVVWWLLGVQWLASCLAAIYGGMRRFMLRSVFIVVSALPLAVPCIMMVLWREAGVMAYVRSYVAAYAALTCGWFVMMLVRRWRLPRIDSGLLYNMSRYAVWAYLSTVMDLMTVRLDVFFLNYLGSIGTVGVYSVAVGLATRIATLPNVIAHVVFHRASAQEIGSGETTAKLVRITGGTMVVAGILLAGAGRVLVVPLYGNAFAGALAPLYVMIPAMVLWGLYRLLASDIEGRGMPGIVSLCSGAAALCIVVLDIAWIPSYGAMGAAWASFISYGVAFAAVAWAFCRVTAMSARAAYAPRLSDLLSLRMAVGSPEPSAGVPSR